MLRLLKYWLRGDEYQTVFISFGAGYAGNVVRVIPLRAQWRRWKAAHINRRLP